jgi:phenylpropionate dioxygenase-like ring-hydroxylating dioxygenase large terminal subunit
MEVRLRPPVAKAHRSVARVPRAWYVACLASELGSAPRPVTILGTPLVLFRDGAGRAAALLDRCPHRNVPLSLGRVADGALECPYHGWRFDGGGRCTLVPGLEAAPDAAATRAPSHAVREQDGLVWVWGAPEEAPAAAPPGLPDVPGALVVTQALEMQATVHAAVENALDVPHTAFLHRGLFRGAGTPRAITAIVRRTADVAECEYRGEPRPEGIVGRLLAPGGGVVEHWDRFILPSIAQVEYRLGTANRLVVTTFCTPVADDRTRLTAVVQVRLRIPARLLRPVLTPLVLRILRQDAAILRAQSETVARFGGEQFASTPLDLLGPHVWRMLRAAEEGVTVPPAEEAPVAFRA